MTAVVGGLITALLWGVSSAIARRSSLLIGAESALAWVFLIGFVLVVPAAFVSGSPEVGGGGIAWTAVAVAGSVLALYAMYAAARRGPVSLLMPIMGGQGAVAAVIAVVFGESLAAVAWVGLALVVAGIYVAVHRRAERAPTPLAVALAIGSAVAGGVGLYATSRGAALLGTAWVIAAVRTAGVLSISLPLALSGRLRMPGRALRYVLFSGVADTSAYAVYAYASSHGNVAVTAVLASQFALVSALIGVAAMGERLTQVQVAGVAAILVGVAIVTAAQA
ncbi:MAG TPA: DMT family transporter [Gaiellaceae bacterium]|jgi:drug/metabolite transporter (DMT)-like permease